MRLLFYDIMPFFTLGPLKNIYQKDHFNFLFTSCSFELWPASLERLSAVHCPSWFPIGRHHGVWPLTILHSNFKPANIRIQGPESRSGVNRLPRCRRGERDGWRTYGRRCQFCSLMRNRTGEAGVSLRFAIIVGGAVLLLPCKAQSQSMQAV